MAPDATPLCMKLRGAVGGLDATERKNQMITIKGAKLDWRLQVVTFTGGRRSVCSIWTKDREGQDVLLKSWEWPSGAPTPDQLRELVAFAVADLESTIVALIGVQGVILR